MKLVTGLVLLACCSYALAGGNGFDDRIQVREFNDVTITQNFNDEPSTFANILLDLLVKNTILDEPTAAKFLVTFKVNGVNRKTDGAAAFTKATFVNFAAKGDADARRKFIERSLSLFDKPDQSGSRVIEYLMEFVLDNDVLEAQDAANLAGDHGYGVKIETTRYKTNTEQIDINPPPPPATIKPRPGTKFYYVVYVTSNPTFEQIHKFINVLLELTIKFNILNEQNAVDILTTFKIKPNPRFEKLTGVILTVNLLKKVKVNKCPIAAKKFLKLIKAQLKITNHPLRILIAVFQLLLDN